MSDSRLRRISGRQGKVKEPRFMWPIGNLWNGRPVAYQNVWPFEKQPWARVK